MRYLKCVEIRAGELGLIVEHLFKMRDVPETIHGVAVEAAPEMIVHAALGHLLEGKERHVERVLPYVSLLAGGNAKEQIERNWMRKFRRPAEAAQFIIEGAGELIVAGADLVLADAPRFRGRAGIFAERSMDCAALATIFA